MIEIRLLDTIVLAPPELLAVNDTVKVPGSTYVCDGLCAVEVPESPKSQLQLVGEPVEVSVKLTGNPTTLLVGLALKFAIGGGGRTVMYAVLVLVLETPALVTVKDTV